MSGNLRSYSGITTKSKAKQGKLLKKEDYEELLSQPSVRDFVLFIKSQEAYRPFFETFNENIVHRGQIEKVLKHSLFESYESLYSFANEQQRKQMALVSFHYEINILSECLRRVYSKDIDIDYRSYQKILNNHINLPLEQLVEAKSIETFLDALKGTRYEHVFEPILNSKSYTLFDLLMHLNCYYYKTVWKLKNKVLTAKQNVTFTKCIGSKIDVQNLMLIYRCKKYYKVDANKILSILIPVNYRLSKSEMNELINTSSVSEFINRVQKTRYKIPLEHVTQEDMERVYYQRIAKAYTDSKRMDPISMSSIFCYLYLKERELDNLTTIIEGIRYGLSKEKIQEFLIV